MQTKGETAEAQIRVKKSVRQRLRVQAAKENLTIAALVEKLLDIKAK